jgi:hypothetical protein
MPKDNLKSPMPLIAKASRRGSGGASAPPKKFKDAIPVYDDGGTVPDVPDTSDLELRRPEFSSMDSNVKGPSRMNRVASGLAKMDVGGEDPSQMPGQEAQPRMYPVIGLDSTAPISPRMFDDGGPVKDDPNDGHHQLAVLEEGERVLTPEENAAYEQEHGAPLDTSGRVLMQPNPPVRPMEDTEHPDTERLSGGAKMDTTLAGGDSQHPVADVSPDAVRTVSAKEPGIGKMFNPLPDTLQPQTKDNYVMRSSVNPQVDANGNPVAEAPEVKMLPIRENEGGLGPMGVESPEQVEKASMGQNVHTPEELKFQRELIKRDMMSHSDDFVETGKDMVRLSMLNKLSPYGSEANHPGKLGKFLHGLATAGEIASDVVLGPGMTSMIPGTRESLNAQQQQGMGRIKFADERAKEQAETELARANAAGLRNEDKTVTTDNGVMQFNPKTGRYDIPVGGAPIKEELEGKTVTTDKGVFQYDPRTHRYSTLVGGAPPKEGANQLLNAANAVVEKMDKAGYKTDPTHLISNSDKALAEGAITADEHAALKGFEATKGDQATKVVVNAAEGANAAARKKAGSYYTYHDDQGTHLVTGDKVPEGAESTLIKDEKVFLNEAHAGNVIQQSMNHLHEDIAQHPEIFDNATARNILATTTEQIDRASAGLLIAGTGGSIPLPSGMGDMINTALQNKALDKNTSAALKQYIADYKAMKDKTLAIQMEIQGGKMGRGSAQAFKAIADQIPNGATPDSKTAKRQMDNLQETHTEFMGNYPEQYGNYTKEKPYKAGQQSKQTEQPKTVTYQGQQVPLNEDGTFTAHGATYKVSSDGRTATKVKSKVQ